MPVGPNGEWLPGGPAGPAHPGGNVPGAALAAILNEGQDNSVLGNVSRFVDRGGYAVRSLMRGEPGDAFENLAQAWMDLPTLGFLNRNLSLANMFSDTGDITDKSERPEFSDVIGYQGTGLDRVAIDVAGGILTDPLTYLTLGGAGAAKGAFHGLTKGAAVAKATTVVNATKAGRAALLASGDDLLRGLTGAMGDGYARGLFSKMDDLLGLSDDVLQELFPAVTRGGLQDAAAAAAKQHHSTAVEKLLRGFNPGLELGVNTGGADRIQKASDLLDDVFEKLVGQKMAVADDALRLELPFAKQHGIRSGPLVRDVWGKIGGLGTAPGLFMKGLGAVSPELADSLKLNVKTFLDEKVRGQFYDSIARSGISQGFQHMVRKFRFSYEGGVKRSAFEVRDAFGDLTNDEVVGLGKKLLGAEDEYGALLAAEREATRHASMLQHSGQGAFMEWQGKMDEWKLAREALVDKVRTSLDADLPTYKPNVAREILQGVVDEQMALGTRGRADVYDEAMRTFEAAKESLNERHAIQLEGAGGEFAAKLDVRGKPELGSLNRQAWDELQEIRGGDELPRLHTRKELVDHLLSRGPDGLDSEVARKGALAAVKRLERRGLVVKENATKYRVAADPIAELGGQFRRELDALIEPDIDSVFKTHVDDVTSQKQAFWLRAQARLADGRYAENPRLLDARSQATKGWPAYPDMSGNLAGQSLLDAVNADVWKVNRLPDAKIAELQRKVLDALTDPRERKAVKAYWKSMQEIPEELVGLGVWKEDWSNPLYVPHQLSGVLAELFSDPAMVKNGELIPGGIRDVFTNKRKYGDSDSYTKAVVHKLLKHATDTDNEPLLNRMREMELVVPVNTIGDQLAAKLSAAGIDVKKGQRLNASLRESAKRAGIKIAERRKGGLAVADGVIETNLKDLMFRRLAAHEQTKWRSGIMKAGKDFGMYDPKLLTAGDRALRDYVDGQLQFQGVPEGNAFRLLAGGEVKWEIGATMPEGLAKAGFKIHEEGGKRYAKGRVRGLNYYVKPLLTSFPANLDFHVRNYMGAIVMTTLDPDLGWTALRETTRSLPGMAISAALGGKHPPGKVALLLKAADGVDGAMDDLLKFHRGGVGRYTYAEVVEILQDGLNKVNQGDLRANLAAMDTAVEVLGESHALMKRAPLPRGKGPMGWAAKKFDAMVEFGEAMANQVEAASRTGAILDFLEQGLDSTEALRRTGRAFVDYRSASTTEAWVRQIFPFAKFQIGSAAWLGEFARRPRLLQPLTNLRNSAEAQLEEGEVLPEGVASSFALPMGKDKEGKRRYLTSLGLPHEASLNMAGSASSFAGFRKGVLASMHPMAKFPLEGATNRDFFFGDEFASYTKSPTIARPLATEVKQAGGTSRYEIPGFWREVFDTLPVSRVSNMIDRFFDEQRPLWDAALQATTGVRFRGVDEEKELNRSIRRYLESKSGNGSLGEFTNWVAKGDPENMPEDLKIVLKGLNQVRRERGQKRKQLQMGRPGGL